MSTDTADTALRVFFKVHTDLPREAPGSRDSTARALAAVGPLPAAPAVLDIGCGPGTQTLDLATLLPAAQITAVDAHLPFVEVARQRVREAGLQSRVRIDPGDMRRLPYAPGSFDLIWCEGAAYIMGVREALTEISLPVARTALRRRAVYRNSALEGKTVFDMGARGAAAAEELEQLIQEVTA